MCPITEQRLVAVNFCLPLICQQHFLFVVDTLLLMKSTRWTWEKSLSLFTLLWSFPGWKEECPMWDSMEVGLAICHSSLFNWLQANIPEQHFSCSPSLLMLKIWNQCVLCVFRAASLTYRDCPWGVSTLGVLVSFVRVPCLAPWQMSPLSSWLESSKQTWC